MDIKKDNLQDLEKEKVPPKTLLRRAFYLLIALCIFFLIPNETSVSILATFLELVANTYDFIAKFF